MPSPLAAMREAFTPYGSPEISRSASETSPFLASDVRRSPSAPPSPRIGTVGVTVSTRTLRNRLVLTLALVVALGSAGTLYHEDAKEAVVHAWRVARPRPASSVHLSADDATPDGAGAANLWPLHRPAAVGPVQVAAPTTAVPAPAPEPTPAEEYAELHDEMADLWDESMDDARPRPDDETGAASVTPVLGEALATTAVAAPSAALSPEVSSSAEPTPTSPPSPPIAESTTSSAVVPPSPSSTVVIKNGYLDTNPPLPSLLPPPAAGTREKYLSYIPHSGFHNQRINLQVRSPLIRRG